jgi:hypothetical protein
MTDTLRADCEALLESLNGYEMDMCKVSDLMAFARAQQAKGLREAAELAEGWIEGKLIARDIRLAAMAREQGERDKPVGMLSAQELNERWEETKG